jgi:hypothetical protein
MYKYVTGIVACLMLAQCTPQPSSTITVQQLCPNYNSVFIEHHGSDSAMYWIPNCFAPGDSTSPNDSLVEFERNMAQVIVTIRDSVDSILMVYDNHTFQYPGFANHTVWYGNYTGGPAPERSYQLQVTGTTLYGTNFTLYGTVSLLRYFFGNDTVLTHPSKVLINCDTCTFNSQWSSSTNNVNLQLSTDEHFVPDTYHQCN